MRLVALFTTFALAALTVAQNTTSTASAASATASIDPQIGCLQKCGSADVCCQAACVNVPCPSQLQANATTECAAQCPQGNGTAEETQQYAECQSECIESYFLSATTSAPSSSATGASDASATGQTEATTTGASSSGSSATRSSGTAAATATGNGAPDTLRMSTIGLGFLSLVAAGLAL